MVITLWIHTARAGGISPWKRSTVNNIPIIRIERTSHESVELHGKLELLLADVKADFLAELSADRLHSGRDTELWKVPMAVDVVGQLQTCAANDDFLGAYDRLNDHQIRVVDFALS